MQTSHKEILQRISRTFQGMRLYSPAHPTIRKQAQDLLAALAGLFLHKPRLKLGLLDDTLFFDDELFAYPSPAEEDVANLLRTLEVEGLEFISGLGADEFLSFLDVIRQGETKGEELESALLKKGVHHIRPTSVEKTDDDEFARKPRKVYDRALRVMEDIFHDVRLGKIPSSEEAMQAVKGMVEVTLSDPHALFALSLIKDYDNYTFTHSVNVSVISLAVGRACGLSAEELRVIGLGGMLHDLGKLKVDVGIITKPGRLTQGEFEQIKKHPRDGADILQQMKDIPPEVVDIALCHHLQYDRKGYPADNRGKLLSPMVDMAAIADAYDAITTLRSYQRPVTPRQAIKLLRDNAGTRLHPQFVERFIQALGPYPVGSLVRLQNNEIGLVTAVGGASRSATRLKILFASEGSKLDPPRLFCPDSADELSIVGEVDPFSKGIEIADYLD
ncbi:HD domain-containing phosphohydrolase [Desulfuromonas sp. AOP6]|uniref:HD-GYP domain-containing protein n=1 Tax=Desulfuromonas sp. AOP6 TaxID=1566351 RepID=UPI0012703992|nr:HD domain-containing phosphohydrolase [Desulfuromonas sp. AOP6]BCA78814.1 cyclic diguanylate phosphodiesterase [Desulfuromonas sp. AOP6]